MPDEKWDPHAYFLNISKYFPRKFQRATTRFLT